MLKAIAQPSDFVAFKLDIDNYIAGKKHLLKSSSTFPDSLKVFQP
jgi:hypothetical protein